MSGDEQVVTLVLASQSPRRVALLREAGYAFAVEPAAVEEIMDAGLPPWELTCANAELKAGAVAARLGEGVVVLGADTLVYVDGHPLGKPADLEEAMEMVMSLAGRTHEVCTGVALRGHAAGRPVNERFHVITEVAFKALEREDVAAYLSKIDPLDKAGGYAAQEHGSEVIDTVRGSWTNVVGLPMEETSARLALLGVVPGR